MKRNKVKAAMNAMTPDDQLYQSVNSRLRRLSPPGELERLAL